MNNFSSFKKVCSCKWFVNLSAKVLFSNVKIMTDNHNHINRSMNPKKNSIKSSSTYPGVIEMCNQAMDGIDLVDPRTAA